MDIKKDTLSVINKIIPLAENNPDIAVTWLYGSRANSTATIQSDFDLAIAFNSFPSDPLERRLRPELLAIDWAQALSIATDSLSVVDINLAPIPLAWEVISKGRIIYTKDYLRLYREENRIFSMYELDVLYHRRQYGQ